MWPGAFKYKMKKLGVLDRPAKRTLVTGNNRGEGVSKLFLVTSVLNLVTRHSLLFRVLKATP
jgi:hypothetical protein